MKSFVESGRKKFPAELFCWVRYVTLSMCFACLVTCIFDKLRNMEVAWNLSPQSCNRQYLHHVSYILCDKWENACLHSHGRIRIFPTWATIHLVIPTSELSSKAWLSKKGTISNFAKSPTWDWTIEKVERNMRLNGSFEKFSLTLQINEPHSNTIFRFKNKFIVDMMFIHDRTSISIQTHDTKFLAECNDAFMSYFHDSYSGFDFSLHFPLCFGSISKLTVIARSFLRCTSLDNGNVLLGKLQCTHQSVSNRDYFKWWWCWSWNCLLV